MQLPARIEDDEIHAPFSPSAMKRIINCPGSYNANKGLKSKPNFYSAEGTVAHEIAANNLSRKWVKTETNTAIPLAMLDWGAFVGSKNDIGNDSRDIIKKDDFEIEVTQELLDAVNVYVSFVRDQINEYDEPPEIERKVKITEDCFGTADSIIYSPYRILIVNDYKHGAGIRVDAERNEQMMLYALGRLLEIPNDELLELPTVQMNIIQPRAGGEPIKTFEMKPLDLKFFWGAEVRKAIAKAKQPDAPLNPGDWCKYCPAALTCPALKKENLAVAKLAFQEPTKWIDVLTPKAIADLLDKESTVMAFYKRLNEHAAELASKNTKIPGYTYEKKWGNRKWKDEEAAIESLTEVIGEKAFDKKLKSPTQIEKLLKMENINHIISSLVEKPFTGYALKKANGKEITVKEVFSDVD